MGAVTQVHYSVGAEWRFIPPETGERRLEAFIADRLAEQGPAGSGSISDRTVRVKNFETLGEII